jgi:hypothetical protein
MKKSKGFLSELFLIFLLILLNIYSLEKISAVVRINEVELNPEGSDSGNEWIELYSDTNEQLINWQIKNNDNQVKYFNASFNGFYIIRLSSQWLDNSEEKVTLLNSNNEIISQTDLLLDSKNNAETWQYCSAWIFNPSTEGKENNCNTNSDSNGGSTNNSSPENLLNNLTENLKQEEIRIEADYDEVENKEFEIKIKFYNLEDKTYDLKISIEDEKVLNENYDEDKEKWVSGNYYLDSFLKGDGDKKVKIKTRIKEVNFSGKAKIYIKLRSKGIVRAFIEDKIKINLKSSENINGSLINSQVIKNLETPNYNYNNTPITLSKNLKNQNSIIYKSKTEYIKEYALAGFLIFCGLTLCILLLNKKWKKEKKLVAL